MNTNALEALAATIPVEVSVFRNSYENTPYQTAPLTDWIITTTGEEAAECIAQAREKAAKKGDNPKLLVPVISPSLVQKTKEKEVPLQERIVQYNGILCGDIDHVPDDQHDAVIKALEGIPGVFFSAKSFSGKGLYFFCQTDNSDYTRHEIYWYALADIVGELTGRELDIRTKDPTRLRVLSYDPAPYINPSPGVFSLPEGFEANRASLNRSAETQGASAGLLDLDHGSTIAAVEDCVAQWEASGLVLGDSTYSIRYDLGTALKNLGEEGFAFYERLCRGYSHPRTPRKEFDCFPAPGRVERSITLTRFFTVMRELWQITPREGVGPRLTADGLPEPFADIARALAETYQIPESVPVGFMMGAAAAAIGTRGLLDDVKYRNFAQLWIVCVAPPGTGKSDCLKWLFAPHRAYDKKHEELFDKELGEWQKSGENGGKPKLKQIVVGDATPEALVKALSENSDGVTLQADELAHALNVISARYSGGGDSVSILLSCFSNAPIKTTRKTSGTISVESPNLSIVGGIQPDKISLTFNKPELYGNGFLERFLFVADQQYKPRKFKDVVIPNSSKDYWDGFFSHCVDMPETTFALSPDAKAKYIEFWELLDRAKFDGNVSRYIVGVCAKTQISVLRWALILQVMKNYSEPFKDNGFIIDGETMQKAIDAMKYFARTAKRIESLLKRSAKRGADDSMSKADLIKGLAKAYPGLNQSALADALGTSQQYINKTIKSDTKEQ